MRLWRISLRELRGQPGRCALSLLSVTTAVAAVVAVSLATDATHRESREMYESVTGRAALEVLNSDGGLYDQRVVSLLEQTPGVVAAVPVLQQATVMYVKGQRLRLMSMAIDPARDATIRDYQVVEGRFLDRTPGVLLQASLARTLGIRVGDQVKFLTRRGVRPLGVVGLLAPRGLARLNPGGIVLLPLPVAQRLFALQGKISVTSLVLDESADAAAVLDAVSRRLPAGLTARRPPARSNLAEQTLQNIDKGLTFAYALMIVLAVFLIANTFLMNVSQRRRQLSILRAIGATRRQLIGILLGEGLALGVVGTVLGCLVGLAGARVLASVMGQIMAAPAAEIRGAAAPFWFGAVVGLGTSLAAAYFPARIAGGVSPLEGMRPAISPDTGRLPLALVVVGLSLYAVAALVVAASLEGFLPTGLLLPSGVIVLMASVIFLAALLPPLASAAAVLLARVCGVESALARRQLLRRRVRTVLTVGLLYLAVATGIGLGTTILNNVRDVRRWHEQTMVGDFYLSTLSSDPLAELSTPIPMTIGDQLRAVPGVTNVGAVRLFTSHVDDLLVVVIAGQFADAPRLPLDLEQGLPETVARQLRQGDVVVGAALAQRKGLRVGDRLVLGTPHGPAPLRIADTAVSYTGGGLVVCIEWSVAQRLFGGDGADAFVVHARADDLAAVRPRLEEVARQHGLLLHSALEVRRTLDAAVAGVVGSLWGLLALGFVVAALGIANTLAMNVLEQTREIALLRVVGMTRRQVRRTILVQAIIMGVLGLAGGLIGGLLTAYMIHLSLPSLLGRHLPFAASPALMAGGSVVAMLLVLAAAWWPAQRAARLNLLIALRYE
jgi:putative ABC transport system permease protein